MPCPKITGCRVSCFHRNLVESYWAAREVWENQREHDAVGYPAEMRDFAEFNPPPLFKAWLIDSKGRNEQQPAEWGAVA